MTDHPTATEALRLAREALEDDQRATAGPLIALARRVVRNINGRYSEVALFHYSDTVARWNAEFFAAARTREPALARAVIAMLGGHDITEERDAFVCEVVNECRTEPNVCRALAAALWRAADESEGGR